MSSCSSFACCSIHYMPQHRQGRGSTLSTTYARLSYFQMAVLERFGASVPHVHCMAWIQQSSCSKALLPQRCFSAIKEYSSPSCPPSCTAILAQFGSLFPPPTLSPSSPFYPFHSQSRSSWVDRERHPVMCRLYQIYYTGVYRLVLIKR